MKVKVPWMWFYSTQTWKDLSFKTFVVVAMEGDKIQKMKHHLQCNWKSSESHHPR